MISTSTLTLGPWVLAGLVAAVSTAAETRGRAGMSAEEEISAAITKFREAFNAGDLATIASYYSDSLVKLRQGEPPENKAEVMKRVDRGFREFEGILEVMNDEIRASGDLAFTRGSLVLTLTPRKGGPPIVVRRRYLEIWKNEGGRWLVIRTMDNGGPQ